MFAITHRSVVFSAAALFTVLSSATTAQNLDAAADGDACASRAQSTSDPSQSEPARQSRITAADDDDAGLPRRGPGFRGLSLRSRSSVRLAGGSYRPPHRFTANLRQGSRRGKASKRV